MDFRNDYRIHSCEQIRSCGCGQRQWLCRSLFVVDYGIMGEWMSGIVGKHYRILSIQDPREHALEDSSGFTKPLP
jgi:hypothetical protein